MVDVSLITSLYRTEAFLPRYVAALEELATEAHGAGLMLEVVQIANAASATERHLLDTTREAIHTAQHATINTLYVPLETLHASWNRGVRAANGRVLGFWNVDDIRYLDGLIEAHKLVTEKGYEIVDFPFEFVTVHDDGSEETKIHPPEYNPNVISPKSVTAPFFMFTPQLYERAGEFDEAFPIAADFDWCMREAVRSAKYAQGERIAGRFYLHGGNITQSSSVSDWVAFNVALLRQEAYNQLRPVDPDQMKKAWNEWNNEAYTLPQHIQAWLWGDGAHERYAAYVRERYETHPILRRLRLALARRGLWQSVEWDAHHKDL